MTRLRSHAASAPPVPEIPPRLVFTALGSGPRGLSAAEARTRRERFGPNELPQGPGPRIWRRLAAQFTDLFAIVLLVAAAITFLAYLLSEPRDTGNLQLSLAILGVVLLNAVIGFAPATT
ncbi:cation-transporting P-type ATPase [Nonomuraea sp. NPDC052129]|uniref:cation-transporting P-type ATPase n=1 Tax=Nonomuraea sp. NPDC052129 TaxID=3154651 RepID=UPI0034448439